MLILQIDRKCLIKQIDIAEQYQKVRHSDHCSEDSNCITHCTTFGLSDSKFTQHYPNCTHAHVLYCPDSIIIILIHDEINQTIEKITDKDIQREIKFGYENASEYIVEWSHHNTTFVLLDKMLRRSPSSHRWTKVGLSVCLTGVKNSCYKSTEKLKVHILEKRGMLVLVGSFVWKDSMPTLATTMTTITAFSPATFSTYSYILAFTGAVQTGLDSLSAGEIITKQLKVDHPHILKLHKRTDNAEKFSSHSMAEVQKVVCEQVSLFL